VVRFLLQSGAKTNVPENGATALELAASLGHREIVELLKQYSAAEQTKELLVSSFFKAVCIYF
jgi:ankyrin repeat protein